MITEPEIFSVVNRVADKLDDMAARIDAFLLNRVLQTMDSSILSSALQELVLRGFIAPTSKVFGSFEEKGLIDEHGSPRTGENLKRALANELAERYEKDE